MSNATATVEIQEVNAGAAAAMGLFVGIGVVFAWNFLSVLTFTLMDKATLNSNKAVQTAGSVSSTSTISDGYGGVGGYCLHYEFHVPQQRSASSFQRMTPAGNLGPCGAKCTGKVQVSQAKYNAHNPGVPKDCVVRYVAADPRTSALLSIGEDTAPEGFTAKQHVLKLAFPLLFGAVWLGFSINNTLASINNSEMVWATAAFVGFFSVVGLCVFAAVGTTVRARMRLSPVPGCKDERSKDFVLTKLDRPYQKPTPPVPAAPTMVASPAAVEMMAVQCPEGVAPGTTIQIALPNGAPPMGVQVPLGVAPGQTFQVAVPAAPPPVVEAVAVAVVK